MDHQGVLHEAALLKGRKPFDESHDRLPGFGLDLIVDHTTGTPDVGNAIGEPPADYAVGGQAFFENALATIIANLNNAQANDPDWEITGVNATQASVFRGPMGGWGMTTAGAPGDQVIVGPRNLALLPGGRDRRLAVGFSTSRRPRQEFEIRVDTTVTGLILKACLSLAGNVSIGAVDDEFGFFFQDGQNNNELMVFAVTGGAATTRSTGLVFRPDVTYRLIADASRARIPRFYVASDDGVDEVDDQALVANATNFPALSDQVTLFPWCSIQQGGQAPNTIEWVDRRFAQWALTLAPIEGGGGPVN